MSTKRVLIVDDSAVVRQTLNDIISAHPNLEVAATANDPFQAADRLRREVPDVIVLDVEMPRMDGITFLRKLMAQRPIPVVICSTLVGKGTATFLAALEAGAVDIIQKPDLSTRKFLEESSIRIQNAVLGAAHAQVSRRSSVVAPDKKLSADAVIPAGSRTAMVQTTQKIVAIGASTGGTEALSVVLQALPQTAPAIVIVQHMPEAFTSGFSRRLNELCRITVKEARNGDSVLPGQALIAPGGASHMLLTRSGANYRVEIREGPLVNRHRPSVDVLFRSVCRTAGANAVGVIMTGMGDDGARGLKEMRDAGARTIGQDAASSVVYGMPAEAKRHGGVEIETGLSNIAQKIMQMAASQPTAAAK